MMSLLHSIVGAQNMVDFSTSADRHHVAAGGPSGPLDLILVGAGVIIVLVVCIYTVKFLLRPRESDPDHIKRRILRDDF